MWYNVHFGTRSRLPFESRSGLNLSGPGQVLRAADICEIRGPIVQDGVKIGPLRSSLSTLYFWQSGLVSFSDKFPNIFVFTPTVHFGATLKAGSELTLYASGLGEFLSVAMLALPVVPQEKPLPDMTSVGCVWSRVLLIVYWPGPGCLGGGIRPASREPIM